MSKGGKKKRRGKNINIDTTITLPTEDQYFGRVIKIYSKIFNLLKPIR